jgi:hypothetical protein
VKLKLDENFVSTSGARPRCCKKELEELRSTPPGEKPRQQRVRRPGGGRKRLVDGGRARAGQGGLRRWP